MSYWTGFNHFVVWGSIIYYFCFQLAFYSEAIVYDYVGVAFEAFANPLTWLTMLLTCAILITPMLAWRFYQTSVHPTLSDRVRLRQRMKKSKSKARDLHIHYHSTFRHSQRSIRSGYAFSHQRGFGDLITSGRNMRERAKEIVTTPVRLTRMLVHTVGAGMKKSPTQESNPLPGASAAPSEPPSHGQFLDVPSYRASTGESSAPSGSRVSGGQLQAPLAQGEEIVVERM
ncbi:hypothetical protein ACOMHN_059068 [Nucella lapillus]